MKIHVFEGPNFAKNNLKGEWFFEDMPRRGEYVRAGNKYFRVDDVLHYLSNDPAKAHSAIRIVPAK